MEDKIQEILELLIIKTKEQKLKWKSIDSTKRKFKSNLQGDKIILSKAITGAYYMTISSDSENEISISSTSYSSKYLSGEANLVDEIGIKTDKNLHERLDKLFEIIRKKAKDADTDKIESFLLHLKAL